MDNPNTKEEVIDFVEPSRTTKEKSDRKSGTKTLLLYVLAVALILAILGLVLGLSFGLRDEETTTETVQHQKVTSTHCKGGGKFGNYTHCKGGGKFGNYTVASDTSVCSEIGCEILQKKGTAVDAAIAAMFCITVVTMHSSGIGGGNFMLIYQKKKRKAVFINAREKAPYDAHENMYINNTEDSSLGSLSAGVPGEVKGFIKAYEKFGKLPWHDLVEPSIKLASEGFYVTDALAESIKKNLEKINDTDFKELLTHEDGSRKTAGDIIVNPQLAETLRTIQEDPKSFYSGDLAKKIAADFEESGGIIKEKDLNDYDVGYTEKVLKLDLDRYTMLSCPLPSGGPVVTQIMNILQNYKFTQNSIGNLERKIETYHRIVEAMKFAYARRSHYGDPDFVNVTKFIKEVLDVKLNKELYEKIWDNSTHDASYYGGYQFVEDKGSTSHLSVIAPNGDTVSVTGSVNWHFGGKFRSKRTGILYNNEMDDFSTPGKLNGFGYQPAKSNFIRPGKRPLSSMSPTIFVDKKTGDVRLAVGAAGGSRIISSTAWVSIMNLWMDLSLEDAVAAPRLHHQFSPNEIVVNEQDPYRISDAVQKGLEKKGHKFNIKSGKSVVQAASYDPRIRAYFGAADPRKGGEAWGL